MKKLMTVLVAAFAMVANAGVYCVDPAATGDGSGSDWSNACTTFAAALAKATAEGDEIRLKAGDYPVTAETTIAAHPGLAIRGGYTGEGETRSGKSNFVRSTSDANYFRLFTVGTAGSPTTIVFDGIGFRNGALPKTTGVLGQAVKFAGTCAATFVDCELTGNGHVNRPNNDGWTDTYGGAIYISGGSLAVTNCNFDSNGIKITGGANQCGHGGAIYAGSSTVSLYGTRFANHSNQAAHNRLVYGGALAIESCSSVVIDSCLFATNNTYRGDYAVTMGDRTMGGAMYAKSCPNVIIRDCVARDSYLTKSSLSDASLRCFGCGCFFYFDSCTVSMTRTVLYNRGYDAKSFSSLVDNANGSLALTNVLFVAGTSNWCLGNYGSGSAIDAVNCTFTGVKGGDGNHVMTAYTQHTGAAKFTNCLFWDNYDGTYNRVGGAEPQFFGCKFSVDPMWYDTTYCHPVSEAGRYDGGWFTGGTWVTTDTTTSPMIDAGLATSSVGDEPQPNGRCVNVGYDGGSDVASKSVMGSDPLVKAGTLMIYSYAATEAVADGALVRADVASTGGGANPSVTLVWDSSDKGKASVSDWAHSQPLGTHAPWDLVSYRISGESGGDVYYRFIASNEKGDAWTDPVRSFQLAAPPTLADGEVRRKFRTTVRLAATLVNDGGTSARASLIWWSEDDPTTKTTNHFSFGEAVASGTVMTWDISGLSPNTSYAWEVVAENSAGTTTLPTSTFVTLPADAAQTFFVGTAEAGLGDGTSWANAGDLRLVLAAATCAGDEIRLLSGEYAITAQLDLRNYPGLTIRGGYTGTDATTRSGLSNLRRDAGGALCRIVYAKASTVTFDGLGFRDGLSTLTGILGMGACLESGCVATFIGCEFTNNGTAYGANGSVDTYGGALYADGGTLVITNGVFGNNYIKTSGSGNNLCGWGGAIYAKSASVAIYDTRFTKNYLSTAHNRNCGGGALCLSSCTSPVIDGCVFQTNYIYRGTYNADFSNKGAGGAGYISSCPGLVIRGCTAVGNYSQNAYFNSAGDYRFIGCGHFFHLYNTSGSIVRSVFYNRGDPNHNSYSGLVDVRVDDAKSATLCLTNVLMVAGTRGWCLTNTGKNSSIEAVNCTFTGVKNGAGSRVHPAYSQYTGAATFKNCIFWDNYDGAWAKVGGSDPVFRDTMTTTDPQWGDTKYCHPVAQAGSYSNGWFTGGTWATYTNDSPAVDFVAAFATDLRETQPNGRHVNAGYDGNTEVASKSYLGPLTEGELAVCVYGDTLPDGDSVTLYGDVRQLSKGAESARVWLAWDAADRGTASTNDWAHVVPCGDHGAWELVAASLSGFSGTIRYRLYADDGVNTAWSPTAGSYTMVVKPTLQYDTEAHPFTHVYRTSAKVHVELVSDGGADATVWATVAPTDDPSAVTEFELNGGNPVAAGRYAIDLTGLAPGVGYTVTVTANNTVGDTELTAKTFTTLAADAKVTLRAAPTAAGYGDGTSWNDPAEIGVALAAATGDGDAVLLQVGTYQTFGHDLYERTNLVIRGGYDASGTPSSGESRLTTEGVVSTSLDRRHLVIRKSTVTLEAITFHRGYNNSTTDTYGQSVGVKENSSVLVTNCTFASNGVPAAFTDWTTCYGGAIGADGGVLTVVDSVFDNNCIYHGAYNPVPYGGAIGVNGAATVSVKNCTFNRNAVGMVHARPGGGGALAFMGGAQATVESCLFTTNFCRTDNGQYVYVIQDGSGYGPWGGTIYTTGAATTLRMKDLTVIGGYAFNGDNRANGQDHGGTFYFANGTVTGEDIEIRDGGANEYGDSTSAGKYATGSITIAGGTVSLTNVAHVGAKRGAVIAQMGGTLELVNGTFAGAEGRQQSVAAGFPVCGYLQYKTAASGAAMFKNCIFWDNKGGYRCFTNDNITVTASYADIEGENDPANHVFSADPQFKQANGEAASSPLEWDYSLRPSSPCMDAGDNAAWGARLRTAKDLSGNPRLRGGRVDLGAWETEKRGLMLIVR